MSATILIVDDEENARQHIGSYLTPLGYEVIGVATMTEARQYIEQAVADVILLDVELKDGYGPDLLSETARQPMRPPIIVITGFGDIEMAVGTMKNGAHDFMQKPINMGDLEKSIQRALEIVVMRRELAHHRHSHSDGVDFVVGSTPKMRTLLDHTKRAAESSVSVLITGETGTGKELLAKAIHRLGPRAKKPFIDVNCAAFPNDILESELFGHEAGAFTSAEKRKHGLMEIADTGILFLDEIASMPLDMQAKILRAIEENSFRRLGGTTTITVDVQIVAASNRDLKAMMKEGTFREDLYYRLKVVDLHIPPLRERSSDIPELVGLFVSENNSRMGKNVTDVTQRALEALMAYEWPGNIRELHNAIDRAVLFCDDPSIDISHLPAELN